MTRVYVSVGSNIDRKNMVRSCMKSLHKAFGELMHSSVYESIAVGFEGDNFYNLVVGFEAEDPERVIGILRNIEREHGRVRNEKKLSPRTLDLDLLLFGRQDLHAQGMDVPREEITHYAFVLGPLAELAPQELHPVTLKNYADMWAEFCVRHPAEADSIWPINFPL